MNKSDIYVGMELEVTDAHYANKPGFKNGDVLVCVKVEGNSFICRNKFTSESDEMLAWELSPLKQPQQVTMNNTPATRKGIQVGDEVVSASTGNIYTLISDDGSDNPLFRSNSSGNKVSVYLGYVDKIKVADVDKLFVGKTITVKVDLRTPAQKAGIEVGDYVKAAFSENYYIVTDLLDGDNVGVEYVGIGGKPMYMPHVCNLTKVTAEEARAATTPSALRGWKVGDYFEITDGFIGNLGDVIRLVKDFGHSSGITGFEYDNEYENAVTGTRIQKSANYVRKLSVAEAEAKIAELKRTPMERAGFKVGDKVVYDGILLTITGADGELLFTRDQYNIPHYVTVGEVQKYDGDYCKLVGLSVGDVVIARGSCVMRDGDIGILKSKSDNWGVVANADNSVVTIKTACGDNVNPCLEFLRKATKAEVIQYLQNATGNVDAHIVKFALA